MNSEFAEKLKRGDLLLGTLLSMPLPSVAEIMAKIGYDWLFIDTEHGDFTLSDLPGMCQAAGDCPCLVRVGGHDAARISRALDSGAAGLIIPMVNSAEEANKVIQASKYPPQGRRGIGLARAQGYGLDFQTYLAAANDAIVMILQVEHIDAVNHIEEIIAVPGIDAILIGPNDLAASMGMTGQFDAPEVLAAIARVKSVCEAAEIPLGFFGVSAESVSAVIEQGFSLIVVGVDALFMIKSASEALRTLRQLQNQRE